MYWITDPEVILLFKETYLMNVSNVKNQLYSTCFPLSSLPPFLRSKVICASFRQVRFLLVFDSSNWLDTTKKGLLPGGGRPLQETRKLLFFPSDQWRLLHLAPFEWVSPSPRTWDNSWHWNKMRNVSYRYTLLLVNSKEFALIKEIFFHVFVFSVYKKINVFE